MGHPNSWRSVVCGYASRAGELARSGYADDERAWGGWVGGGDVGGDAGDGAGGSGSGTAGRRGGYADSGEWRTGFGAGSSAREWGRRWSGWRARAAPDGGDWRARS